MKKLRLKGCLWKPGINGLGVRGIHRLPYRKRFDKAAREHDRCYDIRGDRGERFYFDVEFLKDCINSCESDLQCGFAIVYFVVVRMLGWAFYRYNK